MPIESKAQQRFMYAHEKDKGSTGKAARDFIAAGPAGGSFKSLPETVKKEKKKTQKTHMKDVLGRCPGCGGTH